MDVFLFLFAVSGFELLRRHFLDDRQDGVEVREPGRAVLTSAPFRFSMPMRSSALYAGVQAQTPSNTVLSCNIGDSPLLFQTAYSIAHLSKKSLILSALSLIIISVAHRGVAKFGIALASGARGLGFKSRHSDHEKKRESFQLSLFFLSFGWRDLNPWATA